MLLFFRYWAVPDNLDVSGLRLLSEETHVLMEEGRRPNEIRYNRGHLGRVVFRVPVRFGK